MDLSPHELSDYLIVLREGGVRRAKITNDSLEVEFQSEVEEPFVAKIDAPTDPTPADELEHHVSERRDEPSGYAKLLGENAPKFKPATEPSELPSH